jgi:hypothetical protein
MPNMVSGTMLKYLGKNMVCVRLSDTGAVVSVELPPETERGVQGYKRLAKVTPWSPCRAELELGEYSFDKHSFLCSKFELDLKNLDVQSSTTKYRRVKIPTV